MSKTPCPRQCGRDARMSPLYGPLPCDICVQEDHEKRPATKSPEFYTQTMQTRVQEQRDRHEGDIILPTDHNGKPNEEFRRLYPEKAKQIFDEIDKVSNKNVT